MIAIGDIVNFGRVSFYWLFANADILWFYDGLPGAWEIITLFLKLCVYSEFNGCKKDFCY